VLLGYSSGATLVYAALVQSPPGTFAGGLSLGFCADQDCKGRALCRGTGLHYTPNKRGDFVFEPAPKLEEPWIALQGSRTRSATPLPWTAFASGSRRARRPPAEGRARIRRRAQLAAAVPREATRNSQSDARRRRRSPT
jgi:hypothetical protein